MHMWTMVTYLRNTMRGHSKGYRKHFVMAGCEMKPMVYKSLHHTSIYFKRFTIQASELIQSCKLQTFTFPDQGESKLIFSTQKLDTQLIKVLNTKIRQ